MLQVALHYDVTNVWVILSLVLLREQRLSTSFSWFHPLIITSILDNRLKNDDFPNSVCLPLKYSQFIQKKLIFSSFPFIANFEHKGLVLGYLHQLTITVFWGFLFIAFFSFCFPYAFVFLQSQGISVCCSQSLLFVMPGNRERVASFRQKAILGLPQWAKLQNAPRLEDYGVLRLGGTGQFGVPCLCVSLGAHRTCYHWVSLVIQSKLLFLSTERPLLQSC